MVFSRETQKTKGLGLKIAIAKQLAINQDSEFKKNHNDECKDAMQKNFTKLVARITKEFNDKQTKLKNRREKLGQSY
jgi:malate synthase